jgi:hypothetical protein
MEERGLEQIATLSIDIAIAPGLSSAHKKMTKADPRQRVVMEGYDWAVMSGLRKDPVTDDDRYSSENENKDMNASRDVRTKRSKSRLGYSGEDSDKGLDEYLAARGKQGYKNRCGDTSNHLKRNDDESEATLRERVPEDSNWRSERNGDESNASVDSDDTEKGWKQRYEEWKSRQVGTISGGLSRLEVKLMYPGIQHNLHLRQRGIMQAKPIRTGTWLKDCMSSSHSSVTRSQTDVAVFFS